MLLSSWSPSFTVADALREIRELLRTPNPDDSLRQWIAELTIAHAQHGASDMRYPDAVRASIQQHASRTVEDWK